MDSKVYELLNDQINKELYSAYLYLSFADYYADEGLDGYENWYLIQAAEERDHALIFRKYLLDNDCKVELKAIDQPDKTFKNHLEPLEAGLEHERYVTARTPNRSTSSTRNTWPARTARLLRLLRNRRAQTSRVSGGPALCRSVFMVAIPSTHVMAFMFAKTCGACRHAAFAPPRSNRQRLPGKTRIVVLQEWTCPTKQNGPARAPTRFLMVGHKGFEPLTY